MKRNNIDKCRTLRKNQTEAEKKLWHVLRNRQLAGVKFRRQFPVGQYIVDFYSPEYKLGVEADGGQHYQDKGRRYDESRTKELADLDVKILRFSNLDILNNIEGVCEVILKVIENSKTESPSP
ncbi:MAG: endonuclease domain-containing protein [bacterium]